MKPPFPNSYWLEPDRILCGEYPRDFEDDSAHEKMTEILQSGVRVFLDLTEKGEKKPYQELAESRARTLGIDPSQLEFHRHPIPDVSVPGNQTEMQSILRTIRLARHKKQPLYLHCWGGKGRTGTVAGCAVRDLFHLDGDDGLTRLTVLWQACAKSSHSDSPETEEQRGFVSAFNSVESSGSQVRAALLGAAIGDALGVPVEFQSRESRMKDPVTGMREYGTHHQPTGTWSDDTSMILATIVGFIEVGGYSPESAMTEFASWLEGGKHTPHGSVFDVGNATQKAITNYRLGIPPTDCGGTTEWSNGNGSLMRILPVALAFADDPGLMEKASEMSALTHAHERSRLSCAFFCLVVSELLHGSSVRDATAFAWEVIDSRWEISPQEHPHFERWHPDRLYQRDSSEIHGTGHVIDTLEASLWLNAKHDSFSDVVLGAVNLGDDTDTTGCVAGALAGLIHREADIPEDWLTTLVKRETISDLADSYAEFCSRQIQSLDSSPATNEMLKAD